MFHWEHSVHIFLYKGSQVAPKTQKIVIDEDATAIKLVRIDKEGITEYC